MSFFCFPIFQCEYSNIQLFITVSICVSTIKPFLLISFLSSVCQFLARCQSPTGGFAGGPGQHAHLAPTYAAVNALCIIGTEEAYNVIDRYNHGHTNTVTPLSYST